MYYGPASRQHLYSKQVLIKLRELSTVLQCLFICPAKYTHFLCCRFCSFFSGSSTEGTQNPDPSNGDDPEVSSLHVLQIAARTEEER